MVPVQIAKMKMVLSGSGRSGRLIISKRWVLPSLRRTAHGFQHRTARDRSGAARALGQMGRIDQVEPVHPRQARCPAAASPAPRNRRPWSSRRSSSWIRPQTSSNGLRSGTARVTLPTGNRPPLPGGEPAFHEFLAARGKSGAGNSGAHSVPVIEHGIDQILASRPDTNCSPLVQVMLLVNANILGDGPVNNPL